MLSAILGFLSFVGPLGKFIKANARVVVPIVLIATVAGAYYWHDSRQNAKIEALEVENKALSDTLRSERTYAAALKDTLRDIMHVKPLPDDIDVDVPVPVPDHESADTGEGTRADSSGKPYVYFNDRQHWESWFRQHCTGMVAIDTSAIWENGQGARVEGELYYGEGVDLDRYSWLLITPVGEIRHTPIAKKKPHQLIGIMYSTDSELAGIVSLAYWRGWMPAIGMDYKRSDKKIIMRIGLMKTW